MFSTAQSWICYFFHGVSDAKTIRGIARFGADHDTVPGKPAQGNSSGTWTSTCLIPRSSAFAWAAVQRRFPRRNQSSGNSKFTSLAGEPFKKRLLVNFVNSLALFSRNSWPGPLLIPRLHTKINIASASRGELQFSGIRCRVGSRDLGRT